MSWSEDGGERNFVVLNYVPGCSENLRTRIASNLQRWGMFLLCHFWLCEEKDAHSGLLSGLFGLLLPNHRQGLDTKGNRSDPSLLPRQVQAGRWRAKLAWQLAWEWRQRMGFIILFLMRWLTLEWNKPVLFMSRQRGKQRKCFQGIFFWTLKYPGKSWDKLPLKTVEAPTLNFGELLWGTRMYVNSLRFGYYYIFNCKEQNWEFISL